MASFAGQARRDVRQAYRPAFKSLNRQERRIRAMDRKQRRDEAAFQNWLKDTNAALNAEAAQRDSQLQATQASFDQQVRDSFGASAGDVDRRMAAAGQHGGPGHEGRPQPSFTASSDPLIRAGQAYGRAQSAAFSSRLTESQRRGLALSHATEKNSYAQVALMRAQRRSEVLDALSKVAEARGDLRAKQAADVAKRQSDLEAAAAEAAQQQFENAIQEQRLANEQYRLQQADARLDLSAAGQRERLRQGRVRNQLGRRRLAAGGRSRRGGDWNPNQRANNQVAFDNAVMWASRRARGDLKPPGERRRARPGDVNRVADWLMRNRRKVGGLTRDMAMAAAYKAVTGRNLDKKTRRKLKRTTGISG